MYRIIYNKGNGTDSVNTTIDPLVIFQLGYFQENGLFIPYHSIILIKLI